MHKLFSLIYEKPILIVDKYRVDIKYLLRGLLETSIHFWTVGLVVFQFQIYLIRKLNENYCESKQGGKSKSQLLYKYSSWSTRITSNIYWYKNTLSEINAWSTAFFTFTCSTPDQFLFSIRPSIDQHKKN